MMFHLSMSPNQIFPPSCPSSSSSSRSSESSPYHSYCLQVWLSQRAFFRPIEFSFLAQLFLNLFIPHLTLMMKTIPSFSSYRSSKSFSLYKHCPSLNCLPSSHVLFTPTHPHAHSNLSALHKLMSPFQTSTLNLGSHMCLLFLARKLQFQGIDTFTQTIAVSLCSYHQDGTTSTTIILDHTLMISPLEQPLNFLAHTDSIKHKHGTESMHQLPVPDRDFCPFCPGNDIRTQCRQPLDRTLLYLNKEKEQNQPQYSAPLPHGGMCLQQPMQRNKVHGFDLAEESHIFPEVRLSSGINQTLWDMGHMISKTKQWVSHLGDEPCICLQLHGLLISWTIFMWPKR